MVTMFGWLSRPAVSASRKKRSLASVQLVGLEFRRERHRLDRDDAADLRILAAVDHAHRALAELLLDLVAAEHRLLLAAALQHHGARVGARGRGPAEDDRLGKLLGAVEALLDVAELGVERRHVAEDALGLVELAAALEVERERVEVLHHLLVERRLAELVERHVQLALLLEGEPEHAVGLGALGVRLLLAALGDEVALGGEQRVADHEQRRRQHQLQPQPGAGHEPEVRGEERDEERRR